FADADRPGLDVGFELGHGSRAPVGSDVVEIDAGQYTESILVRACVDGGERARQPIARRVVGAHHHAQVQLVHLCDNASDRIGAGERRRMPVYVDRRKLRPRHRMLRRDGRRPRMVVEDARRREPRRLASARPRFSRARWAFLPRGEPNTIPATLRGYRDTERRKGYGHTTNHVTVHLKPCRRHLARSAVRSNLRPLRYTLEIFRVFLMSSSGFASSTTKSALLPVAIVPRSAMPSSSAGRDVAATIASAGDRPSCTHRAISWWSPVPNVCPGWMPVSVPSTIRAPAEIIRGKL